jgi:hypothetical protein
MAHDFKAMAWAATYAFSRSSGSLCILRDCDVHRTVCARSTRPETKLRISLGVLIDTSAHQKTVIEFQQDVVNSFAEGFAGPATKSLSPENCKMINSHKSGDVGERLPSDLVFTN